MRRMPCDIAAPRHLPRRLRSIILACAGCAGLAVWLTARGPVALAQSPVPAPPAPPAAASRATAVDAGPQDQPKAANERAGASTRIDIRKDDSGKRVITIEKGTAGAGSASEGSRKLITIEKSDAAAQDEDADAAAAAGDAGASGKRSGSRGGKGVRIDIDADGQEFDSFDQLVHDQPAIAAMIVAIVAVIFLSPVLAIALVLVYRFRKTRMMNETMLKLAEKGVVPPGEAIEALATGRLAAPLAGSAAAASPTGSAAAAPIYEQARALRRRAAWSDLRKGVLMGGVGLGLTFYSMLKSGSPNAIGLILLFVGLGYAVLWWFEDRQPGLTGAPPTNADSRPPASPSA